MKKFKDAFNGIKVSFNHKAIVIQCVLGIFAIVGGIIIKLDYYEWFAFILCIALVISLEIVNTCIEKTCNLISEDYNDKIKAIKDMSSAAVLVSSFAALIVCVICVVRRLI